MSKYKAVLCICLCLMLMTGCAAKGRKKGVYYDPSSMPHPPSESQEEVIEYTDDGYRILKDDEDAPIPVNELLDGKVHFYPFSVNGTKLELIAVKDADSKFRVAFNTSEKCCKSGKGYYIADGEKLVCQNCGEKIKAVKIGDEPKKDKKDPCVPIAIDTADLKLYSDTLYIDYALITDELPTFAGWKSAVTETDSKSDSTDSENV